MTALTGRGRSLREDTLRALVSLLDRQNGLANGQRAVDIVRDLLAERRTRPMLDVETVPVIRALAELRATREAEQAAFEARQAAEVRLAEIVGVKRRDKATGFDAEHTAEWLIVAAALAAAPSEGHR